jgi:hypothetical protein
MTQCEETSYRLGWLFAEYTHKSFGKVPRIIYKSEQGKPDDIAYDAAEIHCDEIDYACYFAGYNAYVIASL